MATTQTPENGTRSHTEMDSIAKQHARKCADHQQLCQGVYGEMTRATQSVIEIIGNQLPLSIANPMLL